MLTVQIVEPFTKPARGVASAQYRAAVLQRDTLQEQREAVEGERSVAGNRRKNVGLNFGYACAKLEAAASLRPINVIAEVVSHLRELPRTRSGRAETSNSAGNRQAPVGQTFVRKPLQLRVCDDVGFAALPRS